MTAYFLRMHDGAWRVGFTSDCRDASPIAAELTIAAPLGDADVTVTPAVESTVDGGSGQYFSAGSSQLTRRQPWMSLRGFKACRLASLSSGLTGRHRPMRLSR